MLHDKSLKKLPPALFFLGKQKNCGISSKMGSVFLLCLPMTSSLLQKNIFQAVTCKKSIWGNSCRNNILSQMCDRARLILYSNKTAGSMTPLMTTQCCGTAGELYWTTPGLLGRTNGSSYRQISHLFHFFAYERVGNDCRWNSSAMVESVIDTLTQ